MAWRVVLVFSLVLPSCLQAVATSNNDGTSGDGVTRPRPDGAAVEETRLRLKVRHEHKYVSINAVQVDIRLSLASPVEGGWIIIVDFLDSPLLGAVGWHTHVMSMDRGGRRWTLGNKDWNGNLLPGVHSFSLVGFHNGKPPRELEAKLLAFKAENPDLTTGDWISGDDEDTEDEDGGGSEECKEESMEMKIDNEGTHGGWQYQEIEGVEVGHRLDFWMKARNNAYIALLAQDKTQVVKIGLTHAVTNMMSHDGQQLAYILEEKLPPDEWRHYVLKLEFGPEKGQLVLTYADAKNAIINWQFAKSDMSPSAWELRTSVRGLAVSAYGNNDPVTVKFHLKKCRGDDEEEKDEPKDRPDEDDIEYQKDNTRMLYVGCFDDNIEDHRKLPRVLLGPVMDFEHDLTPEACSAWCAEQHHYFSGVEYGRWCHCGLAVELWRRVDEGRCTRPEWGAKPCPGDPSRTCGGGWILAVYGTGYEGPSGEPPCETKEHYPFNQVSPPLLADMEDSEFNYALALNLSIKFYEAQRSGDVSGNRLVTWAPSSGLDDGEDVKRDLTGGWYDAGDYVKFNHPQAWAVMVLSWGVLEAWDTYKLTGALEDMLRSLKWPVEYFMKCWDADNEKLYVQVGNGEEDHRQCCRLNEYSGGRPAYYVSRDKPGSDVASAMSAALALASVVFRRVDCNYGDKILEVAQELYEFGNKYRGKYSDSVPDANKFYASSSDEDDLGIAALTLAFAVMEAKPDAFVYYLGEIRKHFPNGARSEFSWDDVAAGFYVGHCNLMGSQGDTSGCELMKESIQQMMNSDTTPDGLTFVRKWGSNRYAANNAFIALMASRIKHDVIDDDERSKWQEYGRTQINYMLGSNNLRRSYLIGYGENYPKKPHHRASFCANDTSGCTQSMFNSDMEPVHELAGALVGGPDDQGQYSDSRQDYVQNEVAVDYNAGFQSAVAALIQLVIEDNGYNPKPEPEPEEPHHDFRRVCYTTNWSVWRKGLARFTADMINPRLCSHIMFSFATLENHAIFVSTNDIDTEIAMLRALKKESPHLKIIIAVGGWNDKAGGVTEQMSSMLDTAATRAVFVKSVVKLLDELEFDGLDLDMEYPVYNSGQHNGKDDEGEKFTWLVKDLRAAFDEARPATDTRGRWELSAAVGVAAYLDDAYQKDPLCAMLDHIGLMTYDFHGAWGEYIIGHNAPLYASADEKADGARNTQNVEWAAASWRRHGCPPTKLVIGMPLYGRGYTVAGPDYTMGMRGTGPASMGRHTEEAGYLAYYEICQKRSTATQGYLSDQWDDERQVPFMVARASATAPYEWIGYDNQKSLANKVAWLLREGYGGWMVWDVSLDDFSGEFCNQGEYPLLTVLNKASYGGTVGVMPVGEIPNMWKPDGTTPGSTMIGGITPVGTMPDSTMPDGTRPGHGNGQGNESERGCLSTSRFKSNSWEEQGRIKFELGLYVESPGFRGDWYMTVSWGREFQLSDVWTMEADASAKTYFNKVITFWNKYEGNLENKEPFEVKFHGWLKEKADLPTATTICIKIEPRD